MKKSKGVDMVQNLFGFVGFALAIALALITLQLLDLTAYFDPTYLYYATAGSIILFAVSEMIFEREKEALEAPFNLVGLVDSALAAILLYNVYFSGAETVHRYLIYAMGVLSMIWALAEWFSE